VAREDLSQNATQFSDGSDMAHEFVDRFIDSLRGMPETDVRLDRIPPDLMIATGHDDNVTVFVVRVGDPAVTVDALLPLITMTESAFILEEFAKTKGLIRKPMPIDDAQRVKESLTEAGTEVEIVRPIET
jgi:hypothetical protein